jgi:hypothetical protein
MLKSKLTVLCLSLTLVAIFVSGPVAAQDIPDSDTSTQVLLPDLKDIQSNRGPATAILTYMGGYGHSIFPTPGGGAMMAGTYGAGGPECCKPWLIKLDSKGTPVWQLLYEAEGVVGANNIEPTSDGGYIMSVEGLELMAIKVDADGAIEWAKSYGDGGYTHTRVIVTSDNDYLLLGGTRLDDNGYYSNGRVLRLDQQGEVIWGKVYGYYGGNDYFTSATVAHNGNVVIAGMSLGNYWVLELDKSTGEAVWQRTYGGSLEDDAWTITKIRNKYYLVVGSSDTFSYGGMRNWWAILIKETGDLVWQRAFGGPDAEDPNVVLATSDGGAIIGGGTGSFGAGSSDIWLIKFSARGQIQWQKTYGVNQTEHAWHIQELPSGGFIVVGDSYLYPATYNIWLMVIDANGNVQHGDCGEVGDTSVSPIQTYAYVNTPDYPSYDSNLRPTDLTIDVVEQTLPIEDCSPMN